MGALDPPAPDLSRFQPSQLDPSVVSVSASRMAYSYAGAMWHRSDKWRLQICIGQLCGLFDHTGNRPPSWSYRVVAFWWEWHPCPHGSPAATAAWGS